MEDCGFGLGLLHVRWQCNDSQGQQALSPVARCHPAMARCYPLREPTSPQVLGREEGLGWGWDLRSTRLPQKLLKQGVLVPPGGRGEEGREGVLSSLSSTPHTPQSTGRST